MSPRKAATLLKWLTSRNYYVESAHARGECTLYIWYCARALPTDLARLCRKLSVVARTCDNRLSIATGRNKLWELT